MCLSFLPAEEIVQTFRDFQNLLLPTHPEALHKVVQYVEDNWINSNIWDPSCWSVFGRAVRTNNDTEGWHHHLNILCEKIGHNNINLYELIEVLHREAGLQPVPACRRRKTKEIPAPQIPDLPRKDFYHLG